MRRTPIAIAVAMTVLLINHANLKAETHPRKQANSCAGFKSFIIAPPEKIEFKIISVTTKKVLSDDKMISLTTR